ncbi:hypothetical protein N8Z27_02255 [Crocinitomicaceae bacterium]|jgi:hypothetical protein|nr:hypothetical protein [Crocinitomicaceae bacterium]MDC1282984.1 hypothetical protein [Crocinitomicaceae bacterium]|tara:strand:- start:499 stop:816 length:318 start_codon:yes stop_codon:yes gene_type:complete
MKFVNRGYLSVKPTKLFVDWANKNDEDFNALADSEPSVYLIEEDFYDDEPVLKSHFKKVFKNELMAVSEDESKYPDIKFEIFNEWFDIQMGGFVFDTQEGGLNAD